MASYPGTWQVGNRTVSQAYALRTLATGFTAVAWHMRKVQVPTMAQLAAASPYATTSLPAAPALTRMLRALARTFNAR